MLLIPDGAPLPLVEAEVPDRPPVGAVLLGYMEDGSALVLLLFEL